MCVHFAQYVTKFVCHSFESRSLKNSRRIKRIIPIHTFAFPITTLKPPTTMGPLQKAYFLHESKPEYRISLCLWLQNPRIFEIGSKSKHLEDFCFIFIYNWYNVCRWLFLISHNVLVLYKINVVQDNPNGNHDCWMVFLMMKILEKGDWRRLIAVYDFHLSWWLIQQCCWF